MEQFSRGAPFIGNSHTTPGPGKAPGTKGLPALGSCSAIAAGAFYHGCLVHRMQFPGGCPGTMRSHRLWRRECVAGSLSVGSLVAFYGFVTQLFEPLSGAAELYARAQKTFASVRQVQSVFALCPKVRNAPDAVHPFR